MFYSNMRSKLKPFTVFFYSFLWLMGAACTGHTQVVNEKPHRVVIQLTSGDSLVHKSVLKQLHHLSEGWQDSLSIEVVCHGPGLDFLKINSTPLYAAIPGFMKKGVRFVACENTMMERKIGKEVLLPGISFVKMGLAAIILRQEAGWAYLKAGF